MKRLFPLIVLICFNAYAQKYQAIDTKVKEYPSEVTAKELAKKVKKDFSLKENQVRATFYWVANNIKYNLTEYYNPSRKRIGFSYTDEADKLRKLQAIKDSIVEQTLTTRQAVCEGYAQTLSKVFTLLELENYVIKGYVRNSIRDINNELLMPNHAWNVVKVNEEWMVLDATWAAGSVINGRWQVSFDDYYFNIPRKNYLKTHYPEEKKWMLGQKLSKKSFYSQPIFTPEFLKTDLELINPLKGAIKFKKGKTITLEVKNLLSYQTVLCGLSGYRFAKQPTLIYKNGIGYIKITPTKDCDKLSLVVDGEIYIKYKLI